MSHYYDDTLYNMNTFNCMSGQPVLLNDHSDNNNFQQNCFSRCCGNCRFTHCETRAIPTVVDTSLPLPTCAAINQLNFERDDNRNCCQRRCCNRCCCRRVFCF